jgi:archaellum biogenesis protein FlaJ (TadC family)
VESELMNNISEEIKLLGLIRGGNEDIKEEMTIKVLSQIKSLNDAYLDILSGLKEKNKLIKTKSLKESKSIYIRSNEKKQYLKNSKNLASLYKGSLDTKKISGGNPYVKMSTRIFGKTSQKLAPRMSDLTNDLRAANIPLVTSTYISILILSCILSFVAGSILSLVLGGQFIWVMVFLPLVVFFLFYTYPSSRASEIDKKINFEIPFATIHMGAIAGSNIGPVRLFEILSESKEYPNLGFEVKKVLNQVKVFGYNITNSLKNVAARTRNVKLAELLGGIATNISTGGELKNYLEKKSKSFLMDYKLERQSYTVLAETFLDIYISILIAAPLILILLLLVMTMIGTNFGGIGINSLIFISIIAIVVLNIIFITVLNIKQPEI